MLTGTQVPDGHTCDWVEKYVDRLYSNPHLSANALISGGPGTGKSVLARFILEYFEKKHIGVASSSKNEAMKSLHQRERQYEH
jgi:DNA replication protein DnaC